MRQKMRQARKIVCVCMMACFAGQLLGCEAFVRKFTRKHKKDAFTADEMVLVPQEYKAAGLSSQELYQQYLLFWKSWEDELIESLRVEANQKKRVSSSKEAIKNIELMKNLLNQEAQVRLQAYLEKMIALHDAVANDLYGNNVSFNRATAEQLRRNFLRDFSYRKIKDSLQKP